MREPYHKAPSVLGRHPPGCRPFLLKALACAAWHAAQKATRCAGGWQRGYATKPLPLQDGDCPGRRPLEEGEHNGTESQQPCAHRADVQAPHRVLPKAWKEGHLQPMPRGPLDDHRAAKPMEGRRDNGGAPDAGPRAHDGGHPAQDRLAGLHGLPEGEERTPHVRQCMRTSSTGPGTGSSGQRAAASRPSACTRPQSRSASGSRKLRTSPSASSASRSMRTRSAGNRPSHARLAGWPRARRP